LNAGTPAVYWKTTSFFAVEAVAGSGLSNATIISVCPTYESREEPREYEELSSARSGR
jgi:hypothetical protein